MYSKKLSMPCSRQRKLAFVIRLTLNPLTLTAGLSGLSLLSVAAFAGPTGGNIVGGAGSINQSGLTTTIQQNSSALAINWHSHVGSTKNLPTPEHLNALCRTHSGITPDSVTASSHPLLA